MEPENKTPRITSVINAEMKKEAEWEKTLARMGLATVDVTQVRDSDILYLAEQWQFLQVVESGGHVPPLPEPQIITAKSGWNIINFGDAMATSPGKWIFRGGYFQWTENKDDEGDGSGGIVNPGKGTIHKQAFDSACEIIQLAKEFGWRGVQVVDGHPNMQRAAWVEACRIGVRMDGFVPDAVAEKQRRRIVSATVEEMHTVLKGMPK
ncbi:MAG: hypothetical protein Q8L78_00025 [Coxiellaceae bacterium]|nr:hypothetical protein [Coxiellaceae bacterium]